MLDRDARPPRRWTDWLIRMLPPGRATEALLGDLQEEWVRRCDRGSVVAGLWYRAETLRVAFRYALESRGAHLAASRKTRPPMFDRVLQDVRYALRSFRHQPGWTATVVLTLTLGIGANAAIFTVIEAVLLRPLPFDEPQRLVRLWNSNDARGVSRWGVSYHDFEDWQEANRTFESMAAWNARSGNLLVGDEPRRVGYATVSPGFLATLGVEPALGRAFEPDENEPGNDAVALVAHGLWRDSFGADPEAIGREIVLDERSLTVVGVLPPGFDFPSETAVWKPFGLRPDDAGSRDSYWVAAVGRLAEDVELQQAQADLDRIMAGLAERHPGTNEGIGAFVEPLSVALVGDVRSALLLVWATAGVVLLIACANVANLMLVRANARRRELAVRVSLGAPRGRIVGQLLVESLLLAAGGGLVGLLLASAGTRALVALDVGALPRLDGVGVNPTVVGFALGLSLLTGSAFGLAPALRAAWSAAGISASGERQAGDRRGRNLRRGLAVAELALAVVVLVAAALLLRSFMAVVAQDPGFDSRGVVTLRVEPPSRVDAAAASGPAEYFALEAVDRRRAAAYYDRLLERLRGLPGVEAASMVNRLPLSGSWWSTTLVFDGRPVPPSRDRPMVMARVVGRDYFRTLGVPRLRGRTFTPDDDENGLPVAVVNETLARRYFPDEDPLGRRLTLDPPDDELARWFTVVGVVGDTRQEGLDRENSPVVYTPFRQSRFGHFGDWGMDLVVRTRGEPMAQVAGIREAARAVDPTLPLFQVRTLDQVLSERLAERRFYLTLLALFGAVALALATVGVYGVVAFQANRRTREVGVRVALGAGPRDVFALVLEQGLSIVVPGLALGAAGALAGARLVRGLLFQVAANDPVSLGAAVGVLGLLALAASAIPAWRQARLDPTTALRG